MIFPKITRRNNRKRGPIESCKFIKTDCEISNALSELDIEFDKSKEMYRYLINDILSKRYIDMKKISNLEKRINDNKHL